MRQIKFRGKCQRGYDYSDSDGWIYGSLLQKDKVYAIVKTEDIDLSPKTDDGYSFVEDFGCVPVIPDTVSRFIGRTDKNGSEIYEDHKLKNLLCENGCYDTIYYTLRWDDENLCYMFDCHGYLEERIDYFSNEIVVVDSFRVDDIDFSTLEIMGSIHDNPELLNEKQQWEIDNNEK